jgi:hypothetical protein
LQCYKSCFLRLKTRACGIDSATDLRGTGTDIADKFPVAWMARLRLWNLRAAVQCDIVMRAAVAEQAIDCTSRICRA